MHSSTSAYIDHVSRQEAKLLKRNVKWPRYDQNSTSLFYRRTALNHMISAEWYNKPYDDVPHRIAIYGPFTDRAEKKRQIYWSLNVVLCP